MAIETNVDVLPFGVILAYAIVLNSLVKTKWFNDKQCLWCLMNAEFDHITTNISRNKRVPKRLLCYAFSLNSILVLFMCSCLLAHAHARMVKCHGVLDIVSIPNSCITICGGQVMFKLAHTSWWVNRFMCHWIWCNLKFYMVWILQS